MYFFSDMTCGILEDDLILSEDEDAGDAGKTSHSQLKENAANELLNFSRSVTCYSLRKCNPMGGSLSAYFVLEFISEIYFNKFTISIRSYIFSRICQKIQFMPCSQWKPNQNIPALAVSGIQWLCHISLCRSVLREPTSYRPRLLLEGRPGSGHSSHLAPAVLHALEKFTVYTLDLALLFGSSATAPEETCAQVTDPSWLICIERNLMTRWE